MRRQKLIKNFKKGSIGLEIGVWEGKFSEQLLDETKPLSLTLVDPWMYIPAYEKSLYGHAGISQQKMDDVFKMVSDKFKCDKNVSILRALSEDAFCRFADEGKTFDWIYIDGNHTYEYIKEDLINAAIILKEDGCIALDDCHNNGWWEADITKAVTEFMEENLDWEVKLYDDNALLRRK